MPSTHKLVIGSLSRRSNSNAGVQVLQLNGGRDTAETRREANDQRINRVPLDDAEGSTDEEDDLCSAGGENPLGTSRILDAESRQHLLLAINRAPEKRLRQAFEALASIVDNIPEDTFRMLVRQETARNASGPQLPQEAVAQQQRAGHNHKHLAIVAPAPGATYGEGYQRIYTSQELKDAQSPNHEVHRAAPYIHPAYQMIPRPEVRQWQYLHQPNPQNLPQVPQRQPQGNPAPGPNNALGAVNTPYRPLDLAAARVHYENMARSALSQFNSAQNVAVPVPVPGYVHGRYAMTPSVWRGNAPVYAPPVPPALPGAPDAPRATLIPPLLMAGPGPVPGARMHAPAAAAPQLQPSQALPAASSSSKVRGKQPAGRHWETCARCTTVYEVTKERIYGECKYHSGSLHRKRDTSPAAVCILAGTHASRGTPPDKFAWTCCGRDGKREGCKKGMHVPGVGQRGLKRAWEK